MKDRKLSDQELNIFIKKDCSMDFQITKKYKICSSENFNAETKTLIT